MTTSYVPEPDSNVSRPMPRADTGSRFKNWVSDTLMGLIRLVRRFDHWRRPSAAPSAAPATS